MYKCLECEKSFNRPLVLVERHGLDCEPYEEFYVCPYCKGTGWMARQAFLAGMREEGRGKN